MSTGSLVAFLQAFRSELERTSETYRYYTADRRQLTFYYSPKSLAEETVKELRVRGIDIPNSLYEEIFSLAIPLLTSCRTEARKIKGDRSVQISSNQHHLKVVIGAAQGDQYLSTFAQLKSVYETGLDDFFEDLVNLLEEYGEVLYKVKVDQFSGDIAVTNKLAQGRADLFEGGHSESTGVFESRATDALRTVANKYSSSDSDLLEDLESLGINVTIFRNDDNDSHEVAVQSRVANRVGGAFSQQESTKLKIDIEKAINKLMSMPLYGPGLADLKGSDSIRTRKRKKVTKAVMSPLQKVAAKNKRIKVTQQEDTSLKNQNRSSSLSTDSKVTKGKSKKARVKVPAIKLASKHNKQSQRSYLELTALLNAKLPDTVRKNMISPRLLNRTGRFASSVKVTDIQTTTKGFPSIGYTYQSNPYRVFETGAGRAPWANDNRDPRKLIDMSIREIAQDMAIGRFFTRRV